MTGRKQNDWRLYHRAKRGTANLQISCTSSEGFAIKHERAVDQYQETEYMEIQSQDPINGYIMFDVGNY